MSGPAASRMRSCRSSRMSTPLIWSRDYATFRDVSSCSSVPSRWDYPSDIRDVTLRRVEKGWSAKGLLRPLWQEYPGKRDGLAEAVGTTPTSLSSINSGRRPLGKSLGGRLAEALGVSLLELGAPAEVATDQPAQRLVDRLQSVEEDLARLRGIVLEGFRLLDLEVEHANAQESPRVRRTRPPQRRSSR
jgi:transcriptional regulator with XRE-family HTH domain